MEIAHETGTHAVIKSPHFDRLTPRVSRRGRTRNVHHRTVDRKLIKKKQIRKMNMNQSQYQYWNMWR
mgnify:CR=1 FL=1|jgi:hypothetical protein